jgi:hypothetical protein
LTDDPVEKTQVDTKKAMSDIGNKMAYANADENADVEMIKANLEHNEAEKKVAYEKADAKNAKAEHMK